MHKAAILPWLAKFQVFCTLSRNGTLSELYLERDFRHCWNQKIPFIPPHTMKCLPEFALVALTGGMLATCQTIPTEPRPVQNARPVPHTDAKTLSPAEQKIAAIAAGSRIARYDWVGEQGRCPIGYTKGMALVYARLYCRLKQGDPLAVALAKKAGPNTRDDALAEYAPDFARLGMSNDRDGADTLRHLIGLMFHMGMLETSGRWWLGKDPNNTNQNPRGAEAGLFQASYDSLPFHPLLRPLFESYVRKPSGLVEVFSEGVRSGTSPDLGDGEIATFQRISKACPSFSVEYVALGIRVQCRDWWPIKHHKTELNPDADVMLLEVQRAVDAMQACGEIDW